MMDSRPDGCQGTEMTGSLVQTVPPQYPRQRATSAEGGEDGHRMAERAECLSSVDDVPSGG